MLQGTKLDVCSASSVKKFLGCYFDEWRVLNVVDTNDVFLLVGFLLGLNL